MSALEELPSYAEQAGPRIDERKVEEATMPYSSDRNRESVFLVLIVAGVES
jgi:hypothetical protein